MAPTVALKGPEVGGPYRKVLSFEDAVGVHQARKPKAAPIDRSGLVAVNSYELGYLRDSMDRLTNRELEMQLHEGIRRHTQDVARRHGLTVPRLEGLSRLAQGAGQAEQFDISTPRPQQELQFAPPQGIGAAQTIANPAYGLGRVTEERMAAQATRELAEVYEETERGAAAERAVEHARQSLEPREPLAHGGLAAWHLTAALGHTAGAAGTGILGLANAGVSLASAAGYGPEREVELDDALPPRRQRAEDFITRVAQAASPPEPALGSMATADDRRAARRNAEEVQAAQSERNRVRRNTERRNAEEAQEEPTGQAERARTGRAQAERVRVGRVQAERARIEMAESRRPQSAETSIPYYATRAARDVAGPVGRMILAR
jgi:hypothetical protein